MQTLTAESLTRNAACVSSGAMPTAMSIGTKIGARMAHFADAEVMMRFSIPTKRMMPKIVTCGGSASDFRNSAPAMAISAPMPDAPNTYMNCAAKK